MRRCPRDGRRTRQRLGRLKAALAECDGGHRRLLDAIEAGLLEPDDPTLRERLAALKARRAELAAEIARTTPAPPQAAALTPARLERLGAALARTLKEGDPALRRAYLRLFVARVSVDRHRVELSGPRHALAAAAAQAQGQAQGQEQDGALAGAQVPVQVPSFVRKWRPQRTPFRQIRRAQNGARFAG